MKKDFKPILIAWEITRRCELNCKHCRASASSAVYGNEFTPEECFKLLDNISSNFNPIIILTGGEPLLRSDVFDIARYGTGLGLRVVMATCGVLMGRDEARRIRESGVKRISVSIDGSTPEIHDNFRGVPGAFERTTEGIRWAKSEGVQFQINTTVTKYNVGDLPDILKLTIELGAVSFHPFLLVPTGRGRELVDQELSPEQYEETLIWINQMGGKVPIQIKPTCAPHYYRIVRQSKKSASKENVSANPEKSARHRNHHSHLESRTKGCMGGQYFAFISHTGKVQICGFLEVEGGDVRKSRYNFADIWNNSHLFAQMRDWDGYRGRCGYCEYRAICGGCRARAYAITGDYLAEEPYCVYTPGRRKNGPD
ncbi:MAG: radical SAM protein [Fidelibacterota bacterium]